MSYQAEKWVELQELHRTPKAVLAKLAHRAKARTLECWPSQQTLASDLGMSQRTVRNALAYLEDQGFIERERQHRPKTGYRATDRIRLRMTTVQTVVQTTLTYRDHMAERHPTLYEHGASGDGLPARNAGPTGKTCRAKNRKREQEEVTSTSSTPTSSPDEGAEVDQPSVYVQAAFEDDEWHISVAGLDAYLAHRPFQDVFLVLVELALIEGVSVEDINQALNESWNERWVMMLDQLQDRLETLRANSNVIVLIRRSA